MYSTQKLSTKILISLTQWRSRSVQSTQASLGRMDWSKKRSVLVLYASFNGVDKRNPPISPNIINFYKFATNGKNGITFVII